MTDKELPEDDAIPVFMSRRQRREYERRLAQGEQLPPPDAVEPVPPTPQVPAQPEDTTPEVEESSQHPQPIAADGPGGLQQRPQHPSDLQRQYSDEVHADLGGIQPLPADQRDYPTVPTAQEAEHHEAPQDGEQDDESLGYMLVADGTQATPEPDADAIKTTKVKKRRRTVVMLSIIAVFLGLLVVLGLGVGKLLGWTSTKDYPGPGGAEVAFEVHTGQGAIVIGNRLVEQDIVGSTRAFRNAVDAVESSREIQPGEYLLRYEMPARDAAEVLLRVGEAGKNYLHVNSGYRIDDVYQMISDRTDYSVEEVEEAADPGNFEVPAEARTLEGYVAVGEYHVDWEATPQQILEEMIRPTLEELERLGIEDPEEQHRLVTIASILEAEARPEDFRTVAGIIENRMDPSNTETAGFLQVDATVIYGLGVRQLQFTSEDRQDASNEYNTYQHRGLPPGPIGAPSIGALDAAADPADSDYLYWITTNIETGETKFSTTYEEHREYHQEYRAYCAEHQDICGS